MYLHNTMEGVVGENGERIEMNNLSQAETVEIADGPSSSSGPSEVVQEQETKEGSMIERIPRYVHGSSSDGNRVRITAQNNNARAWQGRESDIAMAVKMVKAVEDDAKAVAGSLATLFSSLQSALSEVTGSSVEHMRCHSEAAGLLQDASIDAAAKGQRFINACLRLNEEMKTMGSLAAQLKTLRQVVDQFEYHASRSLPRL